MIERLFLQLLTFTLAVSVCSVLVIAYSFLKRRDREEFIKMALALVFVLPFLLFLLSGTFHIKFGHQRNFVYLLPVYLIIFFHGLKILLRRPLAFGAVSTCYLVILLAAAASYSSDFWIRSNEKKEMVERALGLKSEYICMQLERWNQDNVMNYYIKRLGLKKTVIFTDKKNPVQVPALLSQIPAKKEFIFIKASRAKPSFKPDGSFDASHSFRIDKYEIYTVDAGIFSFIRRIFNRPDSYIIVYFCRK